MSDAASVPLLPRLLGYGSVGLGVVALVLAVIPSLAPGGLFLGVVTAGLGITALLKKAPKKIAAAGLVAGIVAVGIGAVNGDWESVPAAVTTVDGKEGVGTSRSEAVPVGSSISSEGWTVVVNSVDTVEKDAWGKRPDDFGDLLRVNLTATYDGDIEGGEAPAITVAHETPGGETNPSGNWTAETPFPERATVTKGESITGDLLFDITEMPWKDGYLTVSPSVGGQHVYVRIK